MKKAPIVYYWTFLYDLPLIWIKELMELQSIIAKKSCRLYHIIRSIFEL